MIIFALLKDLVSCSDLREGKGMSITLSTERITRCSLALSLATAAGNQVMMEWVRMDSMMAVKNCVIIVLGSLNFLSCRRKNILMWAFFERAMMFSSYFKSLEMVKPRKRQDSTEATGDDGIHPA